MFKLRKIIRLYIPASIALVMTFIILLTLGQATFVKPESLLSSARTLNNLPDIYNVIENNRDILKNTDPHKIYENVSLIVLKERDDMQSFGYNAVGTMVYLQTFLLEAWKNKSILSFQNLNEDLDNIKKITDSKANTHIELLNEGSIYSLGENYIVMGAKNFKTGYYKNHHPSVFERMLASKLSPQEFFDIAFFHELGHNYHNYFSNPENQPKKNNNKTIDESSLDLFILHLTHIQSKNQYVNNLSEQFGAHEHEAYSDTFGLLMTAKKYPQNFNFYLNHNAASRSADFMHQHLYSDKKLYTFSHATQFIPLFLKNELATIQKPVESLTMDEINTIASKVAKKSLLSYIAIHNHLGRQDGITEQIINDIKTKNTNFSFNNVDELQSYVLTQLPTSFENKIFANTETTNNKLKFSIFLNNVTDYIATLDQSQPTQNLEQINYLTFSDVYFIFLDKNTEFFNPRFFNHFSLS